MTRGGLMDERVSGRIVRRRLTYPLFCQSWELFFHVLLGLLRPFRPWQGGGEWMWVSSPF